jgi:Fuc2NAc and GlcNAc transferase
VNSFAVIAIAGSLVAAVILTDFARRYATRRNILDIPNARSSHSLPTPRAGGLALVATYAIALPVLGLGRLMDSTSVMFLLVCGGIVAVAGFVDDRRSLPASVRLCAHVLAAGIFLIWMYRQSAPWLPALGFGNVWVGVPCALFALTWCTNLFNFMDGIDGLAGSEAIFVTGASAWINSRQGDTGITAAMLCLCAASAGFLIWNWPPAKIFMGDVGSGFLGLMIPMLDLEASVRAAIPLQVWIILGGLFLSDATVTLVRRIAGGERWAQAHRSHAYQRLARRYRSHRLVTVVFIAINLLWLLPWALYAAASPQRATLSLVAALAPVFFFIVIAGAGKPDGGDSV